MNLNRILKKNIYQGAISNAFSERSVVYLQNLNTGVGFGQARIKTAGRSIYFHNHSGPILIAHRGLCSLFPENTISSLEAGLYHANLSQFDIQLTKDLQVIVFHDRYLSERTNIASIAQFANRKAKKDLQQKTEKDEWWVNDFYLQELRRLRVRQVFDTRPHPTDTIFRIPTFEETLSSILQAKDRYLPKDQAGLLIQLKSDAQFVDNQTIDRLLVKKMIQTLRAFGLTTQEQCLKRNFPIIVQSFSLFILRQIERSDLDLPIVHLYEDYIKITSQFLESQLLSKSIGIGISEANATPEVRRICSERGLKIYYWTCRDDQVKAFGLRTPQELYNKLLELGIDGFITQYPDRCREILERQNAIKILQP